jgi:hypothetical protein
VDIGDGNTPQEALSEHSLRLSFRVPRDVASSCIIGPAP